MWKEKYLEEKRKREELEKTLETRTKYLGKGNKMLADEVEHLRLEVKDLDGFKQLGEDADNLRKVLIKFLAPPGTVREKGLLKVKEG